MCRAGAPAVLRRPRATARSSWPRRRRRCLWRRRPTRAALRDLAAKLAPLRRDDAPFADAPRFRAVTWVEPELVCEVEFVEWTPDGRLRAPSYQGLREDKPAKAAAKKAPAKKAAAAETTEEKA